MIMDEMKDRIRQIMEAHHMTQQTFANFVGINAASLSSIFNNRTKPTLNTVEAIKSKIPNLNIEWLMFGHGSMFVSAGEDKDEVFSGNDQQGDETTLDFGGDVPDLFNRPSDHPRQQLPKSSPANIVRQEVKYIERPQRQITEIRIYFDDLTYETFVPKK